MSAKDVTMRDCGPTAREKVQRTLLAAVQVLQSAEAEYRLHLGDMSENEVTSVLADAQRQGETNPEEDGRDGTMKPQGLTPASTSEGAAGVRATYTRAWVRVCRLRATLHHMERTATKSWEEVAAKSLSGGASSCAGAGAGAGRGAVGRPNQLANAPSDAGTESTFIASRTGTDAGADNTSCKRSKPRAKTARNAVFVFITLAVVVAVTWRWVVETNHRLAQQHAALAELQLRGVADQRWALVEAALAELRGHDAAARTRQAKTENLLAQLREDGDGQAAHLESSLADCFAKAAASSERLAASEALLAELRRNEAATNERVAAAEALLAELRRNEAATNERLAAQESVKEEAAEMTLAAKSALARAMAEVQKESRKELEEMQSRLDSHADQLQATVDLLEKYRTQFSQHSH